MVKCKVIERSLNTKVFVRRGSSSSQEKDYNNLPVRMNSAQTQI